MRHAQAERYLLVSFIDNASPVPAATARQAATAARYITVPLRQFRASQRKAMARRGDISAISPVVIGFDIPRRFNAYSAISLRQRRRMSKCALAFSRLRPGEQAMYNAAFRQARSRPQAVIDYQRSAFTRRRRFTLLTISIYYAPARFSY